MSKRVGDWMQTYTGRQFYPFDPRPEDVTIEDVAHALSLLCRFGGHVREFYSVAQHSVLVSRACPPEHALAGLLHDAAEAYVVDLPRPIKRDDGMSRYRHVESLVHCAVFDWFGVDPNLTDDVYRADDILLATEARDLMGGESAGKWMLRYPPLPATIWPWESREAERAFLARFSALRVKEVTG